MKQTLQGLKNGKLSLVVLLLLIMSVTVYRFGFHPYQNTLTWDNLGYYLYLPANMIYHDPGLERTEEWLIPLNEKYTLTETWYQYNKVGDFNVIRYPIGQALLYAPWFFMAHATALIFGLEADGFSEVYQNFIAIGCFLWLVLALFLFRKVLRKLFNDATTSLVLVVMMAGTNLHIYSGTSSPHETLFLWYALMLYITVNRTNYFERRFWIKAVVITGLAALSRPTDAIIILIPLLWGITNFTMLTDTARVAVTHHWKTVIYGAAILAAMAFPQFLYWKLFAGQWLFYSYGNPGEGLDLLSPHTIDFLFSFRKGFFIYTPLMLIALGGFYFLFKHKKEAFFAVSAFYLINIYLVSSWTCWWYAESFGQRAMVQSLPVTLLPLGYLIEKAGEKKWGLNTGFYALIALLIGLNLFQTWQFHHYIFPGDRLTKEAYAYIFLKTNIDVRHRESLMLIDRSKGEAQLPDTTLMKRRLLVHLDYENPRKEKLDDIRTDAHARSGNFSCRLDPNHIYSDPFSMAFSQITDSYYVWLKISAWVYTEHPFAENPFVMATSFLHKGQGYKYKPWPGDGSAIVPGQWNYLETYYLSPEIRNKADKLYVQFWLQGQHPIWVDDLKAEAYEPL